MHESIQMYTVLERKCQENYNGAIDFLPKITIFCWENYKKKNKHVFLPFFFSNRLEKNQNSENCF